MKVKSLVVNALIAAIYVAVALIFAPIAYGPIQVRISEALVLLPFLRRDTVWGITIGCLLANLLNPLGINPLDVIFGTLATLIAACLTVRCSKLWTAAIPPVVINALIVGPVLAYTFTPDIFLQSSLIFGGQVGVGQVISCFGLGIPLMLLVKKLKVLE